MLSVDIKWMETPRTWGLWVPPGGIPIYIRKRDAAILIRWNGREIRSKAASVEQAKRHVVRWIAAQNTKPWGRGRRGGFERRAPTLCGIREMQADWDAQNGDHDF